MDWLGKFTAVIDYIEVSAVRKSNIFIAKACCSGFTFQGCFHL